MAPVRALSVLRAAGFAGLLVGVVGWTVAGDSPYDPVTGAPKLQPVSEALSGHAQFELDLLAQRHGSGIRVVECAPGVAKFPPGITRSSPPGFLESHRHFTILSDGHCAMDTSTPGRVVVPAPVE
jgi:hypothetical protein